MTFSIMTWFKMDGQVLQDCTGLALRLNNFMDSSALSWQQE